MVVNQDREDTCGINYKGERALRPIRASAPARPLSPWLYSAS